MWSLVSKVLELVYRRSRLRVMSEWTFGKGDAPAAEQADRALETHAFGERRLRVTAINPVGHDIPVETLSLEREGRRWSLNALADGPCGVPPCVVPARDRCTFSVPADALAGMLLRAGCSGAAAFRVAVSRSTGRVHRGPRHVADLELYRLWLTLSGNGPLDAAHAYRNA